MSGFDYGQAGLIGIGTPQANPTVEAEMRILLEPSVMMTVVRLTSAADDPSARLRDYLERLERTLEQYDTLRPAAFGFACTGSSYLVGRAAEERIVRHLEAQYGYPILTATAAVMAVLEDIGARRIAIASPYPPALTEAAGAYWTKAGYAVVDVRRIETGSSDTRSIYALGSADVRTVASALRELNADAVLISGTGLPSLQLIAEDVKGPALLSSNLCLAERLCVAVHLPGLNRERWRQRLADAIAPSRTRSHVSDD